MTKEYKEMGLFEKLSYTLNTHKFILSMLGAVAIFGGSFLSYYARAEAVGIVEASMKEPLAEIQRSLGAIREKQKDYDQKFQQQEIRRLERRREDDLFKKDVQHNLQMIIKELQQRPPTQ